MALIKNTHGKGGVRVMRINREGEHADVCETNVDVLLEGDFAGTFTHHDNSKTISTDTVKNCVNVVARGHLDLPNELFCKAISDRFFHDYPQVDKVSVISYETKWSRLSVGGKPHPHSFLVDSNGRPFVKLVATREGAKTTSGIEGFTFLKSTQSGWTNFYLDPLTTIKPTDDRIASTSLLASWDWKSAPASYPEANAKILETAMDVFATTYSYSVQDSLYRMGMAALAAVPEIDTISMAAPNKHYLPINLAPFGLAFDNVVFTPTDDPHGQIECTIGRD